MRPPPGSPCSRRSPHPPPGTRLRRGVVRIELVEEAVDDTARQLGVGELLADDPLGQGRRQDADVGAQADLGGLLLRLDLALGRGQGLAGLALRGGSRLGQDLLGVGVGLLADAGGLELGLLDLTLDLNRGKFLCMMLIIK